MNNDLVTTWKEAWAGHVARMGGKRETHTGFGLEKLKEKDHLEDLPVQ